MAPSRPSGRWPTGTGRRSSGTRPTDATLLGDHRFDDRIEDVSADAEAQQRATWLELRAAVDAIDTGRPRRRRPGHPRAAAGRADPGRRGHRRARTTELRFDQKNGVHADLLVAAPQIKAPRPRSRPGRWSSATARSRRCSTRWSSGSGPAWPRGAPRPASTSSGPSTRSTGTWPRRLDGDPFTTLRRPAGVGRARPAWRAELADVARDVIRPGLRPLPRRSSPTSCCPPAGPTSGPACAWLGRRRRRRLRRTSSAATPRVDDLDRRGDPPDRARRDRPPGRRVRRGRRAPVRHHRLAEIFDRLRVRPGAALRPAATRSWPTPAATWPPPPAAMGDWFGRLPRSRRARSSRSPPSSRRRHAAAYYFPPAADGSRPGHLLRQHRRPRRARTASRRRRSPSTRPSPATTSSSPSPPSWTACPPSSASRSATPPTSRAGASTPSGWPTRWASTPTTSTGSACWPPTRGGPAGWWSTPACTPWAGPGSRPSTSWSPTCRSAVGEIAVEVDRYIAMPGQALAYKIGQREIFRLRADAGERARRPVRHQGVPRRRARLVVGQPAGAPPPGRRLGVGV